MTSFYFFLYALLDTRGSLLISWYANNHDRLILLKLHGFISSLSDCTGVLIISCTLDYVMLTGGDIINRYSNFMIL